MGGTEGFVVSGSEDGEIIFWDVRTKEIVQRVGGHEGVVCWVDTSPLSGTIVSGGLDGTVRIWIDVQDDVEVKQEPELDGHALEMDLDAEDGEVRIDKDKTDYLDDTIRDGHDNSSRVLDNTDDDPDPDRMEE